MSDKLKIFAENMKKKRIEQNKTLRGLAEATGISATAISAYEKQTKVPSLENSLIICGELGCTLDEMCEVEKEEKVELISTYSDAFQWLIRVIDKLNGNLASVKLLSGNISYPGIGIVFSDSQVQKFLNDWTKVRELYLSKTIDEELYIAWQEKKMREYGSIVYQPYQPNPSPTEAKAFKDLQSDDDLPF